MDCAGVHMFTPDCKPFQYPSSSSNNVHAPLKRLCDIQQQVLLSSLKQQLQITFSSVSTNGSKYSDENGCLVCVDGTWFNPDLEAQKSGNLTNIFRLYASIQL